MRRRGAATVELSICLPLFVLVLLGSIETSNLIYLRESLCLASYEAARRAVASDATQEDVVRRATEILKSRRITELTVTTNPRDLASAAAGDPITVTVSVPVHTQSMLPQQVYGQRFISAVSSFVKE
jgi:Flp pilus assembly protein TadG